MPWREYNRIIDEWRTSRGLHNGERAFVLAADRVARLAAVLDAPNLGDRLVEAVRLAGVSPLPPSGEALVTVGSVCGRVRPIIARAVDLGQGLWVTESNG